MATARGNRPAALIDALFARPEAFDFFQAVRLLELSGEGGGGAVGTDNPPARERVRFKTRPSLAFASAEVQRLQKVEGGGPAAEMQVGFLGFVGTAGVLPEHYTGLVLERLQLKDTTLRDFLDIFQHRAISLFYSAWCKYRFPIAFEREVRTRGREDRFTRALYSLVGLGLDSLRGRQPLDDTSYVHEGGHFARRVRSASGLRRALADLFGVPVRVHEFVGRWLEIPEAERCVLPRAREFPDHRVQLGRGATLGARVWEVQSKVELELGPLTLRQLEHLRPGGAGNAGLSAAARSYLGLDIDFDIRLVLAAGESPGIRLGSRDGTRVQLGLNTWLEYGLPVTARRVARFSMDRTRTMKDNSQPPSDEHFPPACTVRRYPPRSEVITSNEELD